MQVEDVDERMPLPDACAGAVIYVLANHHLTSLRETAVEMQRICPRDRWCGSGQEMPMKTLSAAGNAIYFGVV